jgi:disulfide bond formation protein DsbB
MPVRLLRLGQGLNVIGVIVILIVTLFYQYALYQLPCPLCLLQRLGFIGIGLGYLFNLLNGFRSSHYAIIYLSALFILISSQLQIFLHIAPGDPGYGDILLGLHFYTWAYIASLYFIFSTSLLLFVEHQFSEAPFESTPRYALILSYSLLAIILVNAVSVFLQCGLMQCPSDPVNYLLIS